MTLNAKYYIALDLLKLKCNLSLIYRLVGAYKQLWELKPEYKDYTANMNDDDDGNDDGDT